MGFPPRVTHDLLDMNRAIELDRQSRLQAKKIDNEGPDRRLAPPLPTVQPAARSASHRRASASV